MTKVAITGGIGSGKTYVCSILKKRGIKIYDCDDAAKRLMATSESLKEEIKKIVGPNAYIDGKLNKKTLSSFILKDKENASKINAIVHPRVAEDFISSGLKWMECALLFSSGFNILVDKVICVSAPEEIRIKRIIERDKISYPMAKQWISSQMREEEIIALSDFQILNDGIKDVDSQIDKILANLK